MSGSAAKLGRTTAYHHCTLLVNTDRQQLRLSLNGDKVRLEGGKVRSLEGKGLERGKVRP